MAVLNRPWSIFRLVVVLGGAAVGSTACFDPKQPACAFSCAADGLCPSGYSCGTDQLCHRDDGQGSCTATGATGDASADLQSDTPTDLR